MIYSLLAVKYFAKEGVAMGVVLHGKHGVRRDHVRHRRRSLNAALNAEHEPTRI